MKLRSLHQPLVVLPLVVMLFVLAACETQTTTVSDRPAPGERITPRVGLEAPSDLHDLSGYLLRYRVLHHTLPEALEDLRSEGLMPAEGYPGLGNYAYRATGWGTLADGRTIIVVDTAIRIDGHAWCILAEPSRHPRTATLAVSLVPMADLRAAARP
ncbi:MAG: hypothetical protein AAGA29_03420 [Planctomycetota bacterium]